MATLRPQPSGILLLDKPSGPTSHDMVYAVRRGTGLRRVGHAGTLDPLATGLLVICLGSAARLAEYLLGKEKRYLARIRLGQTTNTYDADGSILTRSRMLPGRETVEAALAKFRGKQQQRPPQFSAIKRGGQKAYELARRGEPVELEPRTVEIYSLELMDWQPPDLTLNVLCSAGTYIRSLAHDLGQKLGCGAHLAGLRRTASGSFRIEQAASLAELKEAFAAREWQRFMLPPDAGLKDWPEVRLSAEDTTRVLHGNEVALGEPVGEWGRAYNPAGELIAVLHADPAAGVWHPHKVLSS